MIHAVLFDVGGPLDTEVEHEAAVDADIRAGLQREGYELDDPAYAEACLRAVESFAPDLYGAVIWQLTGHDVDASRRLTAWMHQQSAKRDLFQLRDGISSVLASLQRRGLKLGLAANQPSAALQRLERHDIGHYFENQGVSGVYGYRKPDVRLFLRACEDLGVDPSRCIMVGDRIDNDVVPAKLLGMRTVRLITGRHQHQRPRSWDETPDYEVESVAGLMQALDLLILRES